MTRVMLAKSSSLRRLKFSTAAGWLPTCVLCSSYGLWYVKVFPRSITRIFDDSW